MDSTTRTERTEIGTDSVSLEQFQKSLSESGIMTLEEVQQHVGQLSQPVTDPRSFAGQLVKQGKLTRYQAASLLQGKWKGLVFGNYLVLDKLGQGGMGMVLKARHRRMERIVALKVLSPSVTKNPNSLQRFQREVQAAAKLNHPNIVAAYDADEAKNVHFLVMEYVEGSDLSHVIKKNGPLSVEVALRCIQQAAEGLGHAHQAGITHRDIKPSNLLLDTKGVVKILDMGLARIDGGTNDPTVITKDLTESGIIMGTWDFMAPEQAINTKRADHRSDIYSLGATLYFLLTGKAMYSGETVMEKMMAHQQDPIPQLPEKAKRLQGIFERMVAKKPDDRYQSMADLLADLDNGGTVADIKKEDVAELTGRMQQTLSPTLAPLLELLEEDEARSESRTDSTRTRRTASTQQPKDRTAEHNRKSTPEGKVRRASNTALRSQPHPDAPPETSLTAGLEILDKQFWQRVGMGGGAVALVMIILLWPRGSSPTTEKPEPPPPAPKKVIIEIPDKDGSEKPTDNPTDKPTVKPPDLLKPFTNEIGMKMVMLRAGKFNMGATLDEFKFARTEPHNWEPPNWHLLEGPAHEVRITRPFAMSAYPVTVGQFREFVKDAKYRSEANVGGGSMRLLPTGEWLADPICNWDNPGFDQTEKNPVVCISWNDARAFCDWLSKKTGKTYRLPTEAEWEYACRAGTTTRYSFGNDRSQMKAYGNVADEAIKQKLAPSVPMNFVEPWDDGFAFTAPVGSFKPNAFELYDMHGNVWQWCADGLRRYTEKSLDDPQGPTDDKLRVLRGASFSETAWYSRVTFRYPQAPTYRSTATGFRVVMEKEK